jgi:hypothetical protein
VVSAHSAIVMKALLNKITKMNNLIFDRSKASVDLQEKVGQFFYNNQAVLNVNEIGEEGSIKMAYLLALLFQL